MATDTTITLPLDAATADAYSRASSADQQKIQLLFRVLLREYIAPSHISLKELMNDISDKAQARGLTPEILKELLHDDE
ncbi:MAG TPA: hypothetical protein PJ982_11160 [Lacipirellulaceae bacterium]|nr:hypothetical protein [Lacipirellulaceae bacterium]